MRAIALFFLVLLAGAAGAIPGGWHKSLKDGVKAAGKSGKPLLVVTVWKDGV